MSSCDSKNELGAIYRLEFYKKQKNWKLSTKRQDKNTNKKQHKKPVEKNEKKSVLNTKSYCGVEWEVSNQLNIAFVEAVPEKIQTQPNLSKNIPLSQVWLESVNIWPPEIDSENNYGTSNTDQNIRGEFLKHDEESPTCDHTGGTTLRRKNATERMEELLKLKHCYEDEINNLMKETDGRDPEDYDCTDYDESPLSVLVLSAGDMTRDDWDAAQYYSQESEASDAVGGDWPEDLVYPGPWIQPSITPDLPPEFEQADSFDMSAVDSFGEFCRGADAAPHSSEIDLRLPPSLDISDVSFARLARLSSQQLLRAADLHSRVLRKLLMENEQRQRLRTCARIAGGWDEPTRDPGWGEPTYDPGLLLPLPGLGAGCPGRGRGRLSRPDLWG